MLKLNLSHTHMDLEEWARDVGVLKPYEIVADSND